MMDNKRIDLKGTGRESVDSIHVHQDKDQWRALEQAVMNRRAQ